MKILIPDRYFWEHDLMLPFEQLMHEYSCFDVRKKWLSELSPIQVSVLYTCHQGFAFDSQPNPLTLFQILLEQSEYLSDYYLVNFFGRGKLNYTIYEMAVPILSQGLLDLCLNESAQADSKALLFTLFKENHQHLKRVKYYNDICLKNFLPFHLSLPLRKKSHSFLDFVSKLPIPEILSRYDDLLNDGVETKLQDQFIHHNHFYLLLIRPMHRAVIFKENKIIHGYRSDGMIFNFNECGDRVYIADETKQNVRLIANKILSAYCRKDVSFKPFEPFNDPGKIIQFIHTLLSEDSPVSLFGIRFFLPKDQERNQTKCTAHCK